MALLELLAAMGAGEWVAGAGEGRPIVVASNHHGLVETELLADPLGTQEDTISSAADGKHKVCHGGLNVSILQPLPCFLSVIWYTALMCGLAWQELQQASIHVLKGPCTYFAYCPLSRSVSGRASESRPLQRNFRPGMLNEWLHIVQGTTFTTMLTGMLEAVRWPPDPWALIAPNQGAAAGATSPRVQAKRAHISTATLCAHPSRPIYISGALAVVDIGTGKTKSPCKPIERSLSLHSTSSM